MTTAARISDTLSGEQGTALAQALGRIAHQDMAPISAATRTLDALRRRIIALDLPPDTVLSRQALAEEYHVSQTPLREALQRLETEGLVDIHPQSRTVVTRIDTTRIHQAHFLRLAVEAEVMRRLAVSIDDATLARLRTIIALQEAVAASPDDLRVFQELDEVFHQTLMAAVGQPELHRLIVAQSGHLNRVRRLDVPGEGKIRHILEGHGAIVTALAAHDPEAATAALRAHLSQTISRLDLLKTRHPDYFSA